MTVHLSLCIPTYRRPERLELLLKDIAAQRTLPDEVVVVDNDAAGSARATIERMATLLPFPLRYDIQPIKNISITRNRTIAMSSGEWLAFIDDDERAPPNWLHDLLQAARVYQADGVLAPVVAVLPEQAPAWIRRGRFYDLTRMPTGTRPPANCFKMGNVLLRGSVVRAEPGPFDEAYGLTGGEDGDMLSRLVNKGAQLVWCDEAAVDEPVEPSRLSFRWLCMRAMRGGQDYARHTRTGRYGMPTAGRLAAFLLRALLQMMVAAGAAAISLPLGRHRAAHWAIKAAANFGKLSYFWGWHYREYA